MAVQWVRTLTAALQKGAVSAEAAPLPVAASRGAAPRLAGPLRRRWTEPVASLGPGAGSAAGLRAATHLGVSAAAGTFGGRAAVATWAGTEPVVCPVGAAAAGPRAKPRWAAPPRRAVAHLASLAAAALLPAGLRTATLTEPVAAAARGAGVLLPPASLAATPAATVPGVRGAAAHPGRPPGALANPGRPARTVALASALKATAALLAPPGAGAKPMAAHAVCPGVTPAATASLRLGAMAVALPVAAAAAAALGAGALGAPPLGVAVGLGVARCGRAAARWSRVAPEAVAAPGRVGCAGLRPGPCPRGPVRAVAAAAAVTHVGVWQ